MKTLYDACINRLGLSQSEAAALHGVRIDTIKSWATGRRSVPDGAWAVLRAYEAQIIDRSEAIREAWEDAGEIRDIDALSDGSPLQMLALADFFLSTDDGPPISLTVSKR